VTIHDENPFMSPPESRDRVRQFRGRLAAGVTIVTAGHDGMTASSVLVVEGEEPRFVVAVSEMAEFWEAVEHTAKFVVHVASAGHRQLSDRFAELAPSPGGVFAGLEVTETEWGPLLAGFDTWGGCRVESATPLGFQRLLVGVIEYLEVGDLIEPLIYFRGRYRSLG
jgi:flavin reductase (DIM6/NTAB) family NADH-FMN oxidoreductase RutF